MTPSTPSLSFLFSCSCSLSLFKVKNASLFLFFFLRTFSLAALLLLLLACNGVTIFCLYLPFSAKPTSKNTHFSPKTQSGEEENHLSKELETHRSFKLLTQKEDNENSLNRSWFRILNSWPLTKQFFARAKGFFSSNSCKLCFFMTWISSLESFGFREFFTVASVFKSHPSAFLLILSKAMDSRKGNIVLRPMLTKGYRVMAIAPDFEYLFRNTDAEAWFNKLKKGNVDPGEVSLGKKLSNLLRLDVFFADLRNAIGAQTIDLETGKWSRLNNAVMALKELGSFCPTLDDTFGLNDWAKWGWGLSYLHEVFSLGRGRVAL
ncbi:hypothetical protein AMTRI_Chr11g153540 [Amborella trichopoda]